MKIHLYIATGAVALALIASPAFADSDRGDRHDRFGLNIGSIISELKKDKHERRGDNRDNDKRSATSTVSVRGTVTAVSSTIITLTGENGATYTVQAANASFDGGVLADVRVGDTLKVKGTMSGTVLVATHVHNKDHQARAISARLDNLRAGIVTSVSGGTFTLTRFGTGTSATITTNASTTVKVNGKATTTAAITPGSAVIVVASSSTTTPDTAVGQIIHVINKGFGALKHFLFR
jgi:hypothetical protein